MLKSYHFFLFVLIFSSCSNSQFKTLTGHWEGNMTSDGKTLEVKIDFNNDKCFFDIPQMGFFAQPFEDIQINGSKIELSVDKENEIIITGEIEKDKISAAIENTPGIFISLHKTSSSPEVYTEEEVSYKSGDIKLSGTLIYPKNSSPPHTAVVFIHGSGKMTRETMRNRAYMLVKNGFAALIYDRRGRGKSEGSPEQILPMNILAGDALAGVEFLKTRNDINKEQIGLFGLSQGGWVAPLCTSVSKDVAFIITVSAPGITPDEQNEYVVKKHVV